MFQDAIAYGRSGVNHGSSAPPKRIGTSNFIEDYLLYLLARVSHVLSSELHRQLGHSSVESDHPSPCKAEML